MYQSYPVPEPEPQAASYFEAVNRDARALAVQTGRYVTVRYGDDAPNSRNQSGLTYDPTGEIVLLGSALPSSIERVAQLVALANAALDAGLEVRQNVAPLTGEKGGE